MTNPVGMTSAPTRHRWRALLSTFVVVAALGIVGTGSIADAGDCESGDTRATCVDGNAVTCADAGITAPNELFEDSSSSANDANVSGTTSDGGTLLNVTVTNPEFAVIAVIVKGGNAYNIYNSNVSDMHAPLVGGPGNIPQISHWLVCYGPAPETPPPDAGQAPDVAEQLPQGVVAAQPQFTG